MVGPGLISNLQQQLGANNVAAQGVDYPASAAGNVPGGDSEGPQTMAQLVQQAASQCGSTQIVLGGYSQGASVVHQAAQQFQGDAASKIKAAVLFGDPAVSVDVLENGRQRLISSTSGWAASTRYRRLGTERVLCVRRCGLRNAQWNHHVGPLVL